MIISDLVVVDELRKNCSLQYLADTYGIKANRSKKYPQLVLLKYDQLNSPMNERIVQECRGLILNESNNWGVVCFPYMKFFNFGDSRSQILDIKTTRIMEKLDGSIMSLYFFDGKWQVSSSGMPDASGPVSSLLPGTSFADLFWETWRNLGYLYPNDTSRCYMFEMMTPYNRIICVYPKSRIVLHGVRNMNTLMEEKPDIIAQEHGWECVRFFESGSAENYMAKAVGLKPLEQEGFVAVDDKFNRLKIKCPQYVSLSHLKEGMSAKRMAEIVRVNESAEFLVYFPEFKQLHADALGKYNALVSEIESVYEKNRGLKSQKEFAIEVANKPYSGVLFALRKGNVTNAKEALKAVRIEKFLQMLDGI